MPSRRVQKSQHSQVSLDPYIPIAKTTVKGLGDNFNQEEADAYAQQVRYTRRTSFKTNKNFEPVWPPPLEAALLQGLCQYALLGFAQNHNHPRGGRNVFISKYIFKSTNEVRTAKQVSSRLQQLQANTTDDRILDLIRRRPVPKAIVESLIWTRTLAPAAEDKLTNDRTVRTPVVITARSARAPASVPEIELGGAPQVISLRTMFEYQPWTALRCGMDPTVVILSPVPLAAFSKFEVFKDCKPYLSASTQLLPNGIHGGRYRYLTSIADGHWDVVSLPDGRPIRRRFEWSIVQWVFRTGDYVDHPTFEIVYTFEESIASPIFAESKPRRKNRAPDKPEEQNIFRYELCQPPPPRPDAVFSPGTPPPAGIAVPLSFTFIEEYIPSSAGKKSSSSREEEPQPAALELQEEEETALQGFYSSKGMFDLNLVATSVYGMDANEAEAGFCGTELVPEDAYCFYSTDAYNIDGSINPAAGYDASKYVFSNGRFLGHYPVLDY